MIKLIASDLDGTLLQNDTQELKPRTIELVRRLCEKGIYFVASSGRQYDNERHLFDSVKDQISYIAENGSLCIHKGKVISRTCMDPDLVRRIIAQIKKDNLFEIMLSKEDACIIESRSSAFINHVMNVMKNTTKIVEDVRNVTGPVLKIAVCNMAGDTNPLIIEQYLRRLQARFQPEIKVVTSGNIWIDFIAPGTNKGAALLNLLNELQIKPEECVAFGDQYNDIEMLQTAGTSYAMANAAPGVEKYATRVTKSVEDVLENILAGTV